MRRTKEIEERRTANRFPIQREVHYRTLGKRKLAECGLGQTINISSAGVLFTTDLSLRPGNRMEVAINWPAQLNESVALQLVAQGRIVRCGDGKAAIKIQHYEFRTCSRASWKSPEGAIEEVSPAMAAAAGAERIGPAREAVKVPPPAETQVG